MSAPGMASYPQVYYEDLYVTEVQKSNLDYLKGNMDHWVSSLVQPKPHIKTYRDYYNGVRDNTDFEYLTENYGIGTPATLKFTNIIKPRVDSLVSQLESDSYTYSVSCTDNKTIDLIQEDKKKKKIAEIESEMDAFTKTMRRTIEKEGKPAPYSELQVGLSKITDKYSTNFVSDFEVAAQKVCVYFERNNVMELRVKLALLVHDLIITGECYWRVYFTRYGSDPIFEVIKPENFFHNKSTNNPFIDGTDAVVHREYMTHKQVSALYGKFMTKDQMKELFGGRYMTRSSRSLSSGLDIDMYYGEQDPVLGQKHFNSAYTVEVMHIEWLATNELEIDEEEIQKLELLNSGIKYKVGEKVRRLDRYEGTRIGGTVYVNCGKSEQVPRTQNDPYTCGFSYGGLLNNDRNGKPYSIVGALKDLQDVYDLTLFYRDNLIANSGVKGDRVNIAGIPKVLGDDFMTRLFTHMALKKNGYDLIDPTEQGAQLFNHYGSYDNTVDGGALSAIAGILSQIEHQADILSGTSPQMRGMIEERSAVANVKAGLERTMMTNQPLFELFRGNQNRIMQALVSNAQLSFITGRKLSYIAGAEAYTFELIPDKFSYTDYAISISYASKESAKVAQLKGIAKEFISANIIDPDVMVNAILSDSATEISQIIAKNFHTKKLERDELGKMMGKIEQYEADIKSMKGELNNVTQQLEASKSNNSKVKEKEIELKHIEAGKKLELEEEKAAAQKEFNDSTLELKKEVVQLEREQLYLGVGNAKEIKNL